MRTAELREAIGQDVFVYLPYEGGSGWAMLLDPDAAPEDRRPGATVAVAFYEGEVWPLYWNGLKFVRPADVLRVGTWPGLRKPRVSPLEEAHAALKTYGEHLWDCSLQKDETGNCSCGLDAALDKIAQAA